MIGRILFIICLSLSNTIWAAELGDAKVGVFHATKEAATKADGFDVYDTPRNREFSGFTIANHGRVKMHLGSAYAGEWTEYASDGTMHQMVAVTREVAVDRSVFPKDYYKFVRVRHSYAELESVQQKLIDRFASLTSNAKPDDLLIHTIGINVQINKVEVQVFSRNAIKVHQELLNMGFNLDMIDIKVRDTLFQPVSNYYAGEAIIAWGAGISSSCTGGFVGNVDIYHVLLTAGHCFIPPTISAVYFDLGNFLRGQLIGHLWMHANGGLYGMDYAAFSNSNFVHTIHAGIRVPPSSIKTVKTPLEIGSSLVNRRICAYGKTSGWRCGQISSINQTTTTSMGVTLFGFASVTFCSAAGDSGGPVVLESGDNALGLVAVSSCRGFGGGQMSSTMFQPIMPVVRQLGNFNLWTN